jgi:hypothetical protein
MNRRILSSALLLTLAGGLHLGAQDSAEPQGAVDHRPEAATRQIEEVQGGGTVFLRAAGSNFAPRDSDTAFSYGGAGCTQRDSNLGDSWFTYDVQLPDGAVIDFLRVYFNDTNASCDINSELWAFDGAGGITLLAEANSSGAPGFSSAGSDFFAHPVNNLQQSLVVVVSIQGGVGASVQNCGVRLRYQSPTIFGDGFESGDTSAWDNEVSLQ